MKTNTGLLACALLAGCGAEPTVDPATGVIEVSAVTSGVDLDPDSYTLTVGATTASLAVNDTVWIDLPADSYEVALQSIAANCSTPNATRQVTVVATDTVAVPFVVQCVAATGAIEVTMATTGVDLDTDGYLLHFGTRSLALPVNGTATATTVTPGNHALTLEGQASNCAFTATASNVNVVAGDTAMLALAAQCAQNVGEVEFVTRTTGYLPDPNGYTAAIDGASAGHLDLDGALVVTVCAGTRALTLTDIALNCNASPSSASINVPFDTRVTWQVNLTCFNQLVYTTGASGAQLNDVYVQYANGAGRVNLTTSATEDEFPIWSPDGAEILFHTNRDGNYNVYRMRPDGTGVTPVTTSVADEFARGWSPDGNRVAYISMASGQTELYVSARDGTNPLNVSQGNAIIEGPTNWSPDGLHILFATNRGIPMSDRDIWIADAVNGGAVRLTTNALFETQPVWSPDGTRFAFIRAVDGANTSSLIVANADGSNQQDLTQATVLGNTSQPKWSPDGQLIAFRGGTAPLAQSHVYVIRPDGTGLLNLSVALSGGGDHPSFSPDGLQAVFRSSQTGFFDVHIINRDGTGRVQLTATPGGESFPQFRPGTPKSAPSPIQTKR